jgi:hypothetical protein
MWKLRKGGQEIDVGKMSRLGSDPYSSMMLLLEYHKTNLISISVSVLNGYWVNE